ncbi:VOC family protein [Limibaculum sp. M0105]|uniref:VOC family protein n=1 Tax=Thermohalobaculum xanthum TaxID=2753746 RepID=A0A8J7M8Y0_9RHOB|nr:VOC family protein [Thermohalobaculum xanthum]MBK0399903.1 VOC family protein [Thermohalobaculum xanthum]
MPARILETAIYADNLAETAAFYEEVLGLERFAGVEGRHVFFRVEGGVFLIFRPAATRVPPTAGALPVPPHGPEGQGHVCFAASAAEIERWRARLDAAGVAIESDFEWPQGGRSIYFRDPAGNSVEFAEPRIWGL